MHRRDFLHLFAAGSLCALAPNAYAARSERPAPRKLIVLMLRGAIDGLSVVAPVGDANYARMRPTIALPRAGSEGGVLDLDGYFGLHPALRDLHPLWQQKKLAFVHASGSHDATRSHFDAQDYMESGTPGRKNTQDGWLNRLLMGLPGVSSPTRAISMGPVMPRILSGAASTTNLAWGNAGKPDLLDRPKIGNAFEQLYAQHEKFGRVYRESRQAHRDVMAASLESEMQAANNGAPLPNGFATQAARLAALMRQDANIQLAFIAVGGWDTHANQGASSGQLANRLNPLGTGLATLATRLGPLLDDTMIVVMSEFGRTVRENGNRGTDHGHGNAMWLLGGRVNGGAVHGEWPGLEDGRLYEGRDLAVTTDFRHVLAHVAERHLLLGDRQLDKVFPNLPKPDSLLRLVQAG